MFGAELALVLDLRGDVAQRYHGLTEREFLEAMAVSMITPGSVMIAAVFTRCDVANSNHERE